MPPSPPIFTLFKTEYKNLGVFSVPALIAGILIGLNVSVPSVVLLGLSILVAVMFFIPKVRLFRPIIGLILFLLVGWTAMSYQQEATTHLTLDKPLYHVVLTGDVEEVTPLSDTQKVTLTQIRFLNEPSIQIPERIRLKYSARQSPLSVGTRVRIRASLRPPSSPMFPNGYHEKQRMRFEKIGAVGTLENVEQEIRPLSNIRAGLEQLRTRIGIRIQTTMPDEAARIAIPLTIGEQSVVSERLYHLFRSAGITHILSVSGFHLSLLMFFIFILVRKTLSLCPVIADRYSTKKIAVPIALLFAVGYLAVSGMQIPAIRSFIMVAIVCIGLMTDRRSVSVRSLSIAAFILLLYKPSFLLNIGFQLSFMAVMVLVTLYQPIWHFIFPVREKAPLFRLFRFIVGFIIVDALMTLTLTPLIIYHFNQYALYSCLGNVLTGVILSFWIMPMLFLSLAVMPTGWDTPLLKGAALGVEYIIDICEKIGNLPGAILYVPSFGIGALLTMCLGTVMLCLMVTRLRLIGLGVMTIGIIWAYCTPLPDVLVGDNGRTVAVRQDGHLRFLSRGESDYTSRYWLLKNGENPDKIPAIHPADSVIIKDKVIAFGMRECIRADLCFLSDKNPRQPNALSLYTPEVRAVYVRPSGIRVEKP